MPVRELGHTVNGPTVATTAPAADVPADGDTVLQKADWMSSVLAGASVASLAGAGLVALGFRQRRPVLG